MDDTADGNTIASNTTSKDTKLKMKLLYSETALLLLAILSSASQARLKVSCVLPSVSWIQHSIVAQ